MREIRDLVALAVTPVLGVLFATALVSSAGNDASRVAHTLQVKNTLSTLLSTAQDIEIGQRGYLVTGQSRYLEPYKSAVTKIYTTQRQVAELVADNPDQTKRVSKSKDLIAKRVRASDDGIALYNAGQKDGDVLLATEDRGKEAMDKIRQTITEAQDGEDELFVSRQSDYVRQRSWLITSLIISLFAAAGVAYGMVKRETVRNEEIERANLVLEEAKASLELKVEERTAHLAKERDRAESLLRDVTHRIGNTLSLVVGFLNLHIRHSSDTEAIKTLTGARERVMAISSAQRRMNVSNDLELVRIDRLIKGVLDDLSEAQTIEAIKLDVDIPPLNAPAREATSLCVLIQEFVINAIKHAFPQGRRGRIAVKLRQRAEKGAVLEVADDGVGYDSQGGTKSGLGTQISDRLARQFQGSVTYRTGAGLTVVVDLPDLTLTEAEDSQGEQPQAGLQRSA
jgi:two-component sensor histidine kinase